MHAALPLPPLTQPETGQTVLHIACQRSNAYAVQLLADAGADLAQQDVRWRNATLAMATLAATPSAAASLQICGRNVFHWGAIGLTGKVLRRLIDQTTSDVWDAADVRRWLAQLSLHSHTSQPFLAPLTHSARDTLHCSLPVNMAVSSA